MGFNKLRFKVEPVGFDYLYDESDRTLVNGVTLVGILEFL